MSFRSVTTLFVPYCRIFAPKNQGVQMYKKIPHTKFPLYRVFKIYY